MIHFLALFAETLAELNGRTPNAGPSGQALGLKTHGLLEGRPIHIPAPDGTTFKTELTLYKAPDDTIKLTFWHAPDPRTTPHTHPWAFTSYIMKGGYVEERYDMEGNLLDTREYEAGDINEVPLDVAHRVVSVVPGTVTLMICGTDTGGWFEVVDGKPTRLSDPDFVARFKQMNPFPK